MTEKKTISHTLKSTNIKQNTACLPNFILFTMSSSLKNHDFVWTVLKESLSCSPT